LASVVVDQETETESVTTVVAGTVGCCYGDDVSWIHRWVTEEKYGLTDAVR
jgi:hypothetical protein